MMCASVCSGIGAPEVAWSALGWRFAFAAEIEKFPAAVYAHHFPDVPNLGDMTKFKEWPDAAIDVLVGGTPCQSFSVAGLRKGLADPRGNLALTYLEIAARYKPRWLVWENVPGVLSSLSHDAPDPCPPPPPMDMGCDGQEMETEDEYDSEELHALNSFLAGLSELGYGWSLRVCDAQYYGVPQRRRRVFVVGYLGDWTRAAAVLFERESLQGHSPPSRETGEGVAPTTAPSLTASGRGVERTGESRGQDPVIAVSHDPAMTLTAREYKGALPEADLSTVIAHSRRAEGFDASEDGTGMGGQVAVAIQERAVSEGTSGPDGKGWRENVAYTLEARNKVQSVQQAMSVRRLTPLECSRLQGFPDDYLEMNYADAEEAHTAQILHELWREAGKKTSEEQGRGTGIATALLTPEVLLAGVHVGWLSWAMAERCASTRRTLSGENTFTGGFVQALQEARQGRYSPYRRESFEQCAGELGTSLSELPLTRAQVGTVLRSSELWEEAQRTWPLRYALATEAQTRSGRMNPDGPRYKALGNSMAVPVLRWIGERIDLIERELK